MVYGDSLQADVHDGFHVHLMTAVDKERSRPPEGGYALVARLGSYGDDSEIINLTGREPLGGFPERRGGGVWLRYWTNDEFHIPEREVETTFLVPWPFEYEEELVIPRFLLEEEREEKNTLRLLLAQITLSGDGEEAKTYFDIEPSIVTIDFRWIGEDEIEILPD